MQSLSTCIQMERSLTLTILGDQEILLEAFIKTSKKKQEEIKSLFRNLEAYQSNKLTRQNLKNKSLKLYTKFFMEETQLFLHLNMILFHCLNNLNMKNGQKKKTRNLMMNFTILKKYQEICLIQKVKNQLNNEIKKTRTKNINSGPNAWQITNYFSAIKSRK